ncbi:MAG: response regulator transcription factor [Actinomycetota bacterium]|nr:response regulator transcription factor [Actinomycetota bacterium]
MIDELNFPQFGDESDDGRAQRPRVVIVDDHPSYAEGMATLLRAIGDLDVVGIAHDGNEAITQTEAHRPDLVLMDIRLPERSGIEATRKIRSLFPDVKVVVLSASTEPSDVQDAMKAGACGYLLKQSHAGRLASAVRAALAGETVIDQSLMTDLVEPEEGRGALDEGELHLLKLLSRGLEISTIARQISVSESTVKRQIAQVQKKLGVDNRIQAVVAAAKRGLL